MESSTINRKRPNRKEEKKNLLFGLFEFSFKEFIYSIENKPETKEMSLKKGKSNFTSSKLKSTVKTRPKAQIVVRKAESEESDSSEYILSDDETQWKDTKRTVSDPTPDYHNIQKLVRYVKAGNTTATIVSLCCLKDYDLSISMNQMVRIDGNCFNFTLAPLLDTRSIAFRVFSLTG